MQILRMISGLVFLIRPLRALSRLLVRPFTAIVQSARPTTALMRMCYVALGVVLLFLGAEWYGQRDCATALAIAGTVLLLLRRSAPLVAMQAAGCPAPDMQVNDGEAQMPSDLLKSGWVRKGVAANGRGDSTLSDDPAAVAWSLSGAVNAVFEPDSKKWRRYMNALRPLVGRNLVRWNGDSSRTQEEVVATALEAEARIADPHCRCKRPMDGAVIRARVVKCCGATLSNTSRKSTRRTCARCLKDILTEE